MSVEDINCFDFSKFYDLEKRFANVQKKIDDIEKDFGQQFATLFHKYLRNMVLKLQKS